MPDHAQIRAQVPINSAIFRDQHEEGLLPTHRGGYALMSNGEFIQAFFDPSSAFEHADAHYQRGEFSLHCIGPALSGSSGAYTVGLPSELPR